MDQKMKDILTICLPSSKAQSLRRELEELHFLDKSRRLQRIDEQTIAIPVKCTEEDILPVLKRWPDIRISDHVLPPSKVKGLQTPFDKVMAAVSAMLKRRSLSETLLEEIPRKWEQHGDLILIPSDAFKSPQWQLLGQDLWTTVAHSLSSKRIARHSPIASNGFRTSQVALLLGKDGKVIHKDNGIQYSYDVTKCMFSAGNITEKLRVSQFHCEGQVVVDLFAGIGYFTLPYLVHSKAEHVHACEWNPEALEALRENLHLNGVADRCTIHEGDNKKLCLMDIADRVNLGLIPTSEHSWPVAVRTLKRLGGLMHIHGNVTTTTRTDLTVYNCSENTDRGNIGMEDSQSSQPSSSHRSSNQVEKADLAMSLADSDLSTEVKNAHHINRVNIGSSSPFAEWASHVANHIIGLLNDIKGGQWTAKILHIEKVKSYAPHIDHVVLDLDCRPSHE